MKLALPFSLLLAMLGSCQKEDMVEAQPAAYPQTWQLVKATSSWTNTVYTGADLLWQEKYVFQADSTFTKTRNQNGQSMDAHGTFSVRTYTNGQEIILTYNAASDLIGSCTLIQRKEYLLVKATDTLVNTWEACDGPRLEYEKVMRQN